MCFISEYVLANLCVYVCIKCVCRLCVLVHMFWYMASRLHDTLFVIKCCFCECVFCGCICACVIVFASKVCVSCFCMCMRVGYVCVVDVCECACVHIYVYVCVFEICACQIACVCMHVFSCVCNRVLRVYLCAFLERMCVLYVCHVCEYVRKHLLLLWKVRRKKKVIRVLCARVCGVFMCVCLTNVKNNQSFSSTTLHIQTYTLKGKQRKKQKMKMKVTKYIKQNNKTK